MVAVAGKVVVITQAAKRIVDGLESGAVEVLADDLTVNVKAALSGPAENLTFSLPN